MQFLTARSLLYVRVLCLAVLAFLIVTDPSALVGASFNILLGQAMELPIAQVSAENPLCGILGVVFGTLALADLIPLLAENLDYFDTMVPVRLMLFFALGAYTYFSSNPIVANNLVFVYAFFEIWCNFLIYNNLRDEKYYRLKRYVEDHADEIKQHEDAQIRVPDPN